MPSAVGAAAKSGASKAKKAKKKPYKAKGGKKTRTGKDSSYHQSSYEGLTIPQMIHERRMNQGVTPKERTKKAKYRAQAATRATYAGAAAQSVDSAAQSDVYVLQQGGVNPNDGSDKNEKDNQPTTPSGTRGVFTTS